METQRLRYFADIEKVSKGEDNQAISAFVIFRSMEGLTRSKKAFKIGCCKKCWFRICCCFCPFNRLAEVQFHNRFLTTRSAVEPELLNWQNFGVTRKQRCMRNLAFIIIMLLLTVALFYGILFAESTIAEEELTFPVIECSADITKTLASADAYAFKENTEQANGDFYCYCSNLYNSMGAKGL